MTAASSARRHSSRSARWRDRCRPVRRRSRSGRRRGAGLRVAVRAPVGEEHDHLRLAVGRDRDRRAGEVLAVHGGHRGRRPPGPCRPRRSRAASPVTSTVPNSSTSSCARSRPWASRCRRCSSRRARSHRPRRPRARRARSRRSAAAASGWAGRGSSDLLGRGSAREPHHRRDEQECRAGHRRDGEVVRSSAGAAVPSTGCSGRTTSHLRATGYHSTSTCHVETAAPMSDKRDRVRADRPVPTKRRDDQDHRERVHHRALVPTQPAGREVPPSER